MPLNNNTLPKRPFAQWLSDARQAKGWTMRSLSDKAGVSHPRIVQLEAGDSPSRDMVLRLSAALDLDPAPGLTAAGFLPDGYAAVAPGKTEPTLADIRSSFDDVSGQLSKIAASLRSADDPLLGIGRFVNTDSASTIPLSRLLASAGDRGVLGDPDRADATVADALPGSTQAIEVFGDCMEPTFHSGDILFVSYTNDATNGDMVLAVDIKDADRVVVKQFRDDRGEGRRLVPLNGDQKKEALHEWDYKIVGIVVKKLGNV